MASKKYAYYNKGNKIGIIEQNPGYSSGKLAVAHCPISGYSTKATCEAAGGQWIPGSSGSLDSYGEYTTPAETVTNGLEIEYSYVPDFNFSGQGDYGNAVHRFIGYGSDGTNLLFITMGHDDVEDLSSKFNADQKIYVDSGPWEGVHELKSAGSNKGILTTKTLFNATPNKLDLTVIGLLQNFLQQVILLTKKNWLFLKINKKNIPINMYLYKMLLVKVITDLLV